MILKIEADEEAKTVLKTACDIILKARGLGAMDVTVLILNSIVPPPESAFPKAVEKTDGK